MDTMPNKVIIRLSQVGNRTDDVLYVLNKIQGLRDTPENLVQQAPCYISNKVALALAQKVQMYLERAGAVIDLHAEEQPLSTPPPDRSAQVFDSLNYHLTEVEPEETSSELYEVTETPFTEVEPEETSSAPEEVSDIPPMMEEDITYFDVEDQAPGTELPSYQEPIESLPSSNLVDTPTPQPPSKSRKKRRRSSSQMFVRGAILFVVLLLIGGLVWFYNAGGFSQLTQRYEQSPTVGLVGTLAIENPEGAEITLHSVLATRVYEPVAFDEMPVRLRRGDYFVEARKGGQTLRYPVYIAGRGHRVRLTVEFPTTPIPEGMAYIPAGWFRMGNKETDTAQFGFPDEVPSIDVYVGAFLMSQHEVTNREYAQFINAGGYEQSIYWDALIEDWESLVAQVPEYGQVYGNEGWESVRKYIRTRFHDTDDRPGPRLWEDDIPPYEDGQRDYPVTGITLYEAAAYCRWLSQSTGKVYRLPTEAEWEKAARSYEGYFFSYGNEYDATRANTESEGPKKVGSYPPNGFGVYDITGNVWEWISDQYRDDAYQFLLDTYASDIRNPRIFNAAKPYDRRIVRGGSFRSVNRINAKTTIRYPMFPNDWHTNIGFRYVTTP